MSDIHRPTLERVPSLRLSTVGRAVAAVIAGLLLLRILGQPWPTKFRTTNPDASTFLRLAQRGPLDHQFWFGERPFGYVLFLWVTGKATRLIVVVQAVIYVGAWATLARTAAVRLGRIVGMVTALFLLVLMVQARFAFWTTQILPDSLSLSLSILLVGLWWGVVASRGNRLVVPATGVTIGWIFLRDGNAIVALITCAVSIVLVLAVWKTPPQRKRRILNALLLCCIAGFLALVWGVLSGRPQYREIGVSAPNATNGRMLGDAAATYDSFGLASRLPARGILMLASPSSSSSQAIAGVMVTVLLGFAIAKSRRRWASVFALLLLFSAFVDYFVSANTGGADPRRLIAGAILRINVALVLGTGIAMRTVAQRRQTTEVAPHENQEGDESQSMMTTQQIRHELLRWVNLGLIAAIAAAAFFANELRSADWDPMYMRTLIERQIHFGGSYYVNGIHNKGPLEPIVYHLATLITSWNSYWYAISAFVILAALTVGIAAARCSSFVTQDRTFGFSIIMAVVIHFTISGADYGGVLYSRNIIVAILSVAFVMLIDGRLWSGTRRMKPHIAASIVGFLLGISMQTLTTAVLSVSVLGIGSWWFMAENLEQRERFTRFVIMGTTATATFVSAPIWYIARGLGDVFWQSWWVYGTYMTRSTNRSLAQQLSLGWTSFYQYYQLRPLPALVIAVFTVAAWTQRRNPSRRVRAFHYTLLGWWLAACVEITLTQRYSSHYYSVTTVPTIFMAATLVGYAVRLVAQAPGWNKSKWGAPALSATMVGSIFFANPVSFVGGAQNFSAFRSFSANSKMREQGAGGSTQSVRAILDLVSRENDPLLMWTNEPWQYLSYHRVSATRFIWKSFLVGEVYLGRTSTEWVLPNSWKQWSEDLDQAQPSAVVLQLKAPIDASTPAAGRIATDFETVFQDAENTVGLRRNLVAKLLTPPTDVREWSSPEAIAPTSGWSSANGIALFAQGGFARTVDTLLMANASCYRIDGEVASIDGTRSGLAFRFEDPSGKKERRRLALEPTAAAAGSDSVGFGQTALLTVPTANLPFSILVGRDSAALVVEGRIGAAVRLQGPVRTVLESHGWQTKLLNLKVSGLTFARGCAI